MNADEFSLRLAEHIDGIYFAMLDPDLQASMADQLGVEAEAVRDAAMHPPERNMEDVTKIAKYLIEDEELLNGFTDDDREDVEFLEQLGLTLTCGLFIYGYLHKDDEYLEIKLPGES